MEPNETTVTENAPRAGLAEDCPCAIRNCPLWGNCVECVRGHRQSQEHVPECMQPMLRGLIEQLATRVQYNVTEARPSPGE